MQPNCGFHNYVPCRETFVAASRVWPRPKLAPYICPVKERETKCWGLMALFQNGALGTLRICWNYRRLGILRSCVRTMMHCSSSQQIEAAPIWKGFRKPGVPCGSSHNDRCDICSRVCISCMGDDYSRKPSFQ